MQKILSVVGLITLVLLSGCSSMSKKDCLNANWYDMGVQDGRAGQPESKMNSYIASCNKHDIGIDQGNYVKGRAAGLVTYCQPDNGYQIGLRGQALPMVCPANLKPAFASAHQRGLTEFKIQRDFDDAQNKMAQLETSIENSRAAVINATANLYSITSDTEKATAQKNLNDLNRNLAEQQSQYQKAISQFACAGSKWYQAGNLDALGGRSSKTYDQHASRCLSYHPAANNAHYKQGFSKGLAKYCSFENGVEVGSRGEGISKLCTGAAWSKLQSGHKEGLKQYDEKITIASLRLKTERLNKQIPELNNQLASLAQKLKSTELTTKQKLDLTRQKNRVSYDLSQSETQFQAANDELNCYVADWDELGFAEGERGAVFDNRSKKCRQYDIRVDEQKFENGYRLGLQRYCTEANGVAMGNLGQPYLNVCPRSSAAAFLKGYRPAFAEYQRKALLAEISKELPQHQQRLNSLRTEVDSLSLELDRDGITRSEKLALINEISGLTKQEQGLADDVEKLSAHQQCLTGDWAALGQKHASEGKLNQVRALNCARFSITADANGYRDGYNRGLSRWCTEANGYQLGLTGNDVKTGCSRTAHRAFYNGVANGLAQSQVQGKIEQLKLEKLALIERDPELAVELAAVEQKLLATNLTAANKRKLTQQKLTLQQEQLQIETRLLEIDARILQLGQ